MLELQACSTTPECFVPVLIPLWSPSCVKVMCQVWSPCDGILVRTTLGMEDVRGQEGDPLCPCCPSSARLMALVPNT